MKIIVDAMGGDNAPLEIVRGALDANRNHGVEIILVGRAAEVLKKSYQQTYVAKPVKKLV